MNVQMMEQWQGPLPPPEKLAAFNNAFPGCAERIVARTESQSQHRQELERTVITGNVAMARRGQWIGGGLAAIAMLGGIGLLILGRDIQGYVLLVGEAVSFGYVWMTGRNKQQAELEEKRKALERAEKPRQ
jgi:uncharacterized membrane protein